MTFRCVALTTSSAAQVLADAADHLAYAPEDGWGIVVPRSALARDLTDRILQRRPEDRRSWVGAKVLTVDELLSHFAVRFADLADAERSSYQKALTPIQTRQIIAAAILEVHARTPQGPFTGQVQDGRVAEAVLSSLHRLFMEIEPQELTVAKLLEILGGPDGTPSPRARAIVDVYEIYLARCAAFGVKGPLGTDLAAVANAATDPLPHGLSKLYFVGFDASGPNDIALRLFAALKANETHVARLVLALAYPADRHAMRWSAHGNDMTVNWLRELDVAVLAAPDRLDALAPHAPADLRAMIADPFAYRHGTVPATGAVACVRVPDSQLEIDWVAADIKRRLLADPTLRADDIAVVARNMDEREPDLRRALTTVGIPVVASRQERVVDMPAVRAVLTLFRMAAHDWRVPDVVAAAESPYLGLGMSPTLLSELASQGTLPQGPAEWEERAEKAAANLAPDTPEAALDSAAVRERDALLGLVGGIRRTRGLIDTLLGQARVDAGPATRATTEDELSQTPERWVKALNLLLDEVALEEKVHVSATAGVDPHTCARLARRDIDGMTEFLECAQGWLIGRQYAGTADRALSPRAFYQELEQIAQIATTRTSTYPRKAVQLVDAIQAGLRSWRVVYLMGLTDRVWPRQAQFDEHALTDTERHALRLPTKAERAAKEGLYFQLAAAAAREALVLLTPAADDRGKALVASPFVNCLQLRLTDFQVTQATARTLLPSSEADLLKPDDRDLFAAARYRVLAHQAYTEAAVAGPAADRQAARGAALRDAVAADPVLAPWEASSDGRAIQRLWGIQRVRATIDRDGTALRPDLIDDVAQTFVGIVPDAPQMTRLQDLATAWSPSDLQAYDNCRTRYFLSRVLGIRRGAAFEDDHDEAAAFGTLQHRILERLYRELDGMGLLPPTGLHDVKTALQRLPAIAEREVREYLSNAREQLWAIDFVVLLDVLKGFVRRDLVNWFTRQIQDNQPQLRTRLLALEETVGVTHPITAVAPDGTTFRLRCQLDRIEVIDDLRLRGKQQRLNGWLEVRDYKSNRKGWGTRPSEYLNGQHLQLPLYAYAAEQHVQQAYPELATAKTFSVGELKTSIDVPLVPLQRRNIEVVRAAGGVGLEFTPDEKAPNGDLLQASIDATLAHAGGLVKHARTGNFAPQPGRKCFGCQFRDICRASWGSDGGPGSRHRAAMPLAVTQAEYRAKGGTPVDAETANPDA